MPARMPDEYPDSNSEEDSRNDVGDFVRLHVRQPSEFRLLRWIIPQVRSEAEIKNSRRENLGRYRYGAKLYPKDNLITHFPQSRNTW
jgi:hypothetical protein